MLDLHNRHSLIFLNNIFIKISLFSKFAQINFGLNNDKAKSGNWVGAVDLSSDINSIIYGKVMGFDGIHETLEISSFEYANFLIDGEIVEAFQ